MADRIRRIVAHPAVKVAYFALLVGAAVFYLVRWGDRLPDLLGQMEPLLVVAALAVTFLSSLFYSSIQHRIYGGLGARVSYWTVFRVVSISQLGKYLPGKVMFAGNFYLLSRAAGISNLQIGAAFTISMAMWILSAALCALPVLGLLEPVLRYTVLVLPLLLALVVHPRFLGSVLKAVQKLGGQMRRDGESPAAGLVVEGEPSQKRADRETSSPGPPPSDSSGQAVPSGTTPAGELLDQLGASFYLQIAFLYLATWVLAGLGAYLCLAALASVDLGVYPLALASIALGTVAGFLALFAPVGLGVREGVGALILAPAVGGEVALLALLLLRGITVFVDLALALLSMATGRLAASGAGPAE